MKKQRTKFDLAQADITEINKQLKVNLFVIVMVIFVLSINMIHFVREKSLFYAMLTLLMVVLLFFIIKARRILKTRQQVLTH
ncbi:hypothetical protein [Psychrobacter sp. DM4]|uniref:hypothetical protein n=1 Tax=Psychrobacter sp. DM4 TaxID=3440637 RepID=UPI003F4FF958